MNIKDWIADNPVFEIMGADGAHVSIYADGRVTGYPGEYAIINGILPLVYAAEMPPSRINGTPSGVSAQ